MEKIDYVFPFNSLFKTKEKISYLNLEYLSTWNYWTKRKYEFICLMNKKYEKYLTPEEINKLSYLEQKYFYSNCFYYGLSLILIFKKPYLKHINNQGIKKMTSFFLTYLGFYFFLCSNILSYMMIHNNILPLNIKVKKNKKLFQNFEKVFDHTRIPDWRTYLYCFKIL